MTCTNAQLFTYTNDITTRDDKKSFSITSTTMTSILDAEHSAWCPCTSSQLAQSLTGNIRTLECMNERSGSRDSTAEASEDSGSVVPSFTAAVLVRHELEVVVDDVMALRTESSGDERHFVFCVAPQSGSSNTSNNSFSCFLTTINPQQQFHDTCINMYLFLHIFDENTTTL